MSIARSVYVISDLHIGGEYPNPGAKHSERRRGFRMMTRVTELAAFVRHLARLPAAARAELVINGDFVDFLAEEKGAGDREHPIDPSAAPEWSAFRARRGEALAAFRAVVERDQDLFTALRELLGAGKRLTIVLGNHDLELCLPDVRAALETELGPGELRFIDDGQALDLGDALVDHGNMFDPANAVDHDRLRGVRAVYSRGWYEELDGAFTPPAGSRLVAEVMNPIKLAYGFIDLLKPEAEPLFALLLALEPSYRGQLEDVLRALSSAARTLVPRRGVPYILRNVAGDGGGGGGGALRDVAGQAEGPTELDLLVAELLAGDTATATLQTAGRAQGGSQVEVAGGLWRARWSLFRLLTGDEEGDLDVRIPQVQATLRVLEKDRSFSRDSESPRYLDAAQWLATRGPDQKGYKAIIFGHTHHAKDMLIPKTKARYFNTGTWANLMRFPEALTKSTATPAEVRAELLAFAGKLKENDLSDFLAFDPTYVRLDLDNHGGLIAAELRDYDWKSDRL